MRLTLPALIFLLILTLGNDPLQLPQKRATHYEWDAFIWREIGAIAVTVVLFGAIQALAGSSAHDRK